MSARSLARGARAFGRSFPKPDGGELLVLDGIDLAVTEGRDRRPARTIRIGEVDALEADRRALSPDGRAHPLSRPAGERAGARDRHGVPELRALSLADRARERADRARGARAARAGDPPARAGGHRPDRPGRLRVGLSAGALRRDAAAGRLRAGPRRPSEHPADGRALLRARRAHRGNPAHRLPRSLVRGTAADQGACSSSRTTSRRRC